MYIFLLSVVIFQHSFIKIGSNLIEKRIKYVSNKYRYLLFVID